MAVKDMRHVLSVTGVVIISNHLDLQAALSTDDIYLNYKFG